MKIVGIDLAGKTKNPTGFCFFKKGYYCFNTVYKNKKIIQKINEFRPDLVAIDSPIIEGKIKVRKADKNLYKYGAMPPTMKSMEKLTRRGTKIAKILSEKYRVIEVFPTATAKILDIYEKNYRKKAKERDLKVKNKHEYDAYLCCLTGKMHIENKTTRVGNKKEGFVIIPKRNS